jgi:hypothetical protein
MRPTTTEIRTLVQGFAKHVKELKAPEYKESQVRLNYIDPFWRLLGWDVQNTAQSAPQDVEFLGERQRQTTFDEIPVDANCRSMYSVYRMQNRSLP